MRNGNSPDWRYKTLRKRTLGPQKALSGKFRLWGGIKARRPERRISMPRIKSSALTGTAELNAMIERVAPSILGLLADGVPRTKGVIVQALAGRHGAEAVALALIRLSVTGEVEQTGSKYTLAAPGGDGPPEAAWPEAVTKAPAGGPGRCRMQGARGKEPAAGRWRSWGSWWPGAGLLRRDRRWRGRHRLRPRHLVGRPRRRLRDGVHRWPPSAGSASMVLRGP